MEVSFDMYGADRLKPEQVNCSGLRLLGLSVPKGARKKWFFSFGLSQIQKDVGKMVEARRDIAVAMSK